MRSSADFGEGIFHPAPKNNARIDATAGVIVRFQLNICCRDRSVVRRRATFAEAVLTNARGKLCASASSTLLVFGVDLDGSVRSSTRHKRRPDAAAPGLAVGRGRETPIWRRAATIGGGLQLLTEGRFPR
jgi:hypothetical protein